MNTESIAKKVASLSNDASFQYEAGLVRAKGLLKEMTGQIPDYTWKYLSETMVRNVTAALFGLEHIAYVDSTKISDLGVSD